jgi:hypothetical protein
MGENLHLCEGARREACGGEKRDEEKGGEGEGVDRGF